MVSTNTEIGQLFCNSHVFLPSSLIKIHGIETAAFLGILIEFYRLEKDQTEQLLIIHDSEYFEFPVESLKNRLHLSEQKINEILYNLVEKKYLSVVIFQKKRHINIWFDRLLDTHKN